MKTIGTRLPAVLADLLTAVLAAGVPAVQAAPPVTALPAVNLTVEMRVIDEAQAAGRGGYTLSTRPLAPDALPPLRLQVLNGEPAELRLGRRLPVQWVQAAARGSTSTAASAAAAGSGASGSGAVVQALTWVSEGQNLWVLPRWPGGLQPVQLELRFDSVTSSPLPNPSGSPLPAQRSQQAESRLSVPMSVWTTFAATGTAVSAGAGYTVSTQTLSDLGRQLMQVRVSLP